MQRDSQSIAVRSLVEALERRQLLSGNPAISISDVSHAEDDAGATAYVFTVSLSKTSSKRVDVDFKTEDGTAIAGEDYARLSGTLRFERGQRSKTITVVVNGDSAVEGDETFLVTLRRPSNAFIADGCGIGTIFNDDALSPPPPTPVDPALSDPYEPWYPGSPNPEPLWGDLFGGW